MADLAHAVAALQRDRKPSEIADHEADCCVVARAWLTRLDSSLHRGRAHTAPPAWIARRFGEASPGPPVHWCEIARAATLDRGTAAALARELWSGRCDGIRAVELVERRPSQRAELRDRDDLGAGPADQTLAYHEAIGREVGERLELWDCAACAWRRPAASGSAGALLSVRVRGASAPILRWGGHQLATESWNPIPV